ncbi:MAG: adenylate kinase [Candidatus Omnitrophica bacterium]|nr:adenylate kinase [Candidatus Omnitrophota bacterium]
MRLIFLGPPGAGKGTQAKVISKKFNYPHISTGDILRESVKNNSPVGRQAKGYMDRGELVPDEIVTRIVVERLGRPDASAGFILDGFPRTKKQAVELDKEFKKAGIGIDYAIYFETSEPVVISRLSGRRVCEKCGLNYHITNIRPKKENTCDACGGALFQREDDKVETIKKRLNVYKNQTADLIDYYKDKGVLETVSGDLSVEEVFKALSVLFNKRINDRS